MGINNVKADLGRKRQNGLTNILSILVWENQGIDMLEANSD